MSNRRFDDETYIQSAKLSAFTTGTEDLFFMGFVRYRDILNRRYRMGFWLKWHSGGHGSSGKFLFEGDEDYNYTKQET
jgi:hypothetical protein